MAKAKGMSRDLWKIPSIVFCFVAVFVLGASYVCNAIPPGSYTRTCSNIQYNGGSDSITGAMCNMISGNKNRTHFNNCNQCTSAGGDISNCNGMLECTGRNLPNVGSYKRSCWCCRMTGNTLGCYCNPKKGRARWTTLNNATVFSNIWNSDGHLMGR